MEFDRGGGEEEGEVFQLQLLVVVDSRCTNQLEDEDRLEGI